MTAQLDASNFPIPKDFEEKLKQLEKRIVQLELKNPKLHTMGNIPALSVKFHEENT